MDDAERQRTMDFILQQQAQITAGMQRFEEGMDRLEKADARASRRLDRLERMFVLMTQQFRRERHDLRERIAALIDAQLRTEEAVRSLTVTTDRNSKDISALHNKGGGKTEDEGGAAPS